MKESIRGESVGFTPGPWYVSGEGLNALVRGDDATIVAVRHRHRRERNEANMRLIAAAPEMYEALVEAEAALDMGLRMLPESVRAWDNNSVAQGLRIVRGALLKANPRAIRGTTEEEP